MSASSSWPKAWDNDAWNTGTGLWVIGTLGKLRFHAVTTPQALLRFMACEVIVDYAFERKHNNFGNEINPDLRKPEKSTLQQVSFDDLKVATELPKGLINDPSILPTGEKSIELWCDPDTVKAFKSGEKVVIKTAGGFIFQYIQPNGGEVGGFKGDSADLMNRVSARSATYEQPDVLAHEQLEGCDEDEWSD